MSLPRHYCTECSGSGVTRDYDADLECEVSVRCEACSGCGRVGTCESCWEVAPAVELDHHGHICLNCSLRADEADAADEFLRVARRTG